MTHEITQEFLAKMLTNRRFRKEFLASVPELPIDIEALVEMAERTEQKRMVHISRFIPYTTKALKILGVFDTLSDDYLNLGSATPDPANYYRVMSDALKFTEFVRQNIPRFECSYGFLGDMIRFERIRLSLFTEPSDSEAVSIHYIPSYPKLIRTARIEQFDYHITTIFQDMNVILDLLPYEKNTQFILFVRNPNRSEVEFFNVSSSVFQTLHDCDGTKHYSAICLTFSEKKVLAHFAEHGLLEDAKRKDVELCEFAQL